MRLWVGVSLRARESDPVVPSLRHTLGARLRASPAWNGQRGDVRRDGRGDGMGMGLRSRRGMGTGDESGTRREGMTTMPDDMVNDSLFPMEVAEVLKYISLSACSLCCPHRK